MPSPKSQIISQARVENIQRNLPALPWETRARLLEKYPTLTSKEKSLDVLLNVDNGREVGYDGEDSGGAVDYFEKLCQGTNEEQSGKTIRDASVVLNWFVISLRVEHLISHTFVQRLTHELLGQLAARKETFNANPLTSEQFGELIDLVQNRTITGSWSFYPYPFSLSELINMCSGTSGKFLLRHMLSNPSSRRPQEIATELQLVALSSTPSLATSSASPTSELRTLCECAIADLPSEVAALRAGNKNVLNKIVGHVMRKSRGRADAVAVKALVEKMVKGK
jgi:aspartyl-tRNA(Asn)/glutamyl-tRNA(Gln) amidotransferase subunit B